MSALPRSDGGRRRFTLVMLAISSALFAAWMLCARGYGKGWMDDAAYTRVLTSGMDDFRYFFCSGHEIQGMADICSSVYWHYMLLNGRLANFLMLFYSQLPAWAAPLLHGAAYGFMISGIMRLGLGSSWSRRPLALACIVALVWALFPWWDLYASADFMFNYVWSGAACLWSVSAMTASTDRVRLRWLWLVIPAAMMHEGVSAVVDAGIAAYVVAGYRSWRHDPGRLVLPAAFVIASMVPLMSPGIRALASSRVHEELTGHFIFNMVLAKNWFLPVVFLLYSRYAIRRKRLSEYVSCTAAMLAVFGISLISAAAGRALWAGYLLAAVMLCRVCAGIMLRPLVSVSAAVMLSAATWSWCVSLCRWQWRTSAERDAVFAELRSGHPEGEYVMCHVTDYDEIPWWLFDIPGNLGETGCSNRAYVHAELHNRISDRWRFFAVMPPASTLARSIESLPALPSGLRGDKYRILTPRRQPDMRFELTFGADPEPGASWSHPLYSSRRFGSPVSCVCTCDETGLRLPDGDSVYVYRPTYLPRSLWDHPLTDARPVRG